MGTVDEEFDGVVFLPQLFEFYAEVDDVCDVPFAAFVDGGARFYFLVFCHFLRNETQ
jgi:hypothetical protein